MGELWSVESPVPSPVVAPFDVELGGERYVFTGDRPLEQASFIASADWAGLIPDMLDEESRVRVADRLDDDDDPLVDSDIDLAGWVVASRLTGLGTGIAGWRRAWKVCHALISQFPSVAGLLISHGVDPSVDPLWKSSALIWRLAVVDSGPPEDIAKRVKEWSSRLPFEKAVRRSSEKSHSRDQPFDRREAQRAFLARLNGKGVVEAGRVTSEVNSPAPEGRSPGGVRAARVKAARAKSGGSAHRSGGDFVSRRR